MKKYTVIFTLFLIVFQTAGAQENGQKLSDKRTLNEIEVDIEPLFVPLFFEEFLERVFAETAGFGMKAGYNRILSGHFSVGASFAFITAHVEAESFEAAINSIDTGIHGRYYPWEKFFYLQAGLGLVSFNFDISGTTGVLDDFKKNFDPYIGMSGTFDISFGWRLLLGRHFIINASILSGFYFGDALSTTTLFKLASGGIPALSKKGSPLRFDAAIALGWAF
jgi:hypothetical protein